MESYLETVEESSVLAITSKIVSLCEGRVVPIEGADKEKLVKKESDYYLPASFSKYDYHFTITNNTLISLAGMDESNGGDNYILWPHNSQETANSVREYLQRRFNLKNVGVLVVDSTCSPLRRGTVGIVLAHSGFEALHDYVGTPDLFGRPFAVSQSSIANGLAASAVLVMGEGTEQTPLALISDLSFVTFQNRQPSPQELRDLHISKEDDLFAPFLKNTPWLKGDKE